MAVATAKEIVSTVSKCFIAECRYSLTGASSDIRLPVRPSRLSAIASAIAAGLGPADPAGRGVLGGGHAWPPTGVAGTAASAEASGRMVRAAASTARTMLW